MKDITLMDMVRNMIRIKFQDSLMDMEITIKFQDSQLSPYN